MTTPDEGSTSTIGPIRRVRLLNPRKEWCKDCKQFIMETMHITYTEWKKDQAEDPVTIYWDYFLGACGHAVGEDRSH